MRDEARPPRVLDREDATRGWSSVAGTRTASSRQGLPIHVVDEDIYGSSPTLVIATADKFATLPWVKGAHALFGVDDAVPPPELIVQDELHLISGPLGTLAGLYEAAIDLLCTDDGVRPKVIASTATIRRAGRQTRALFDRDDAAVPAAGHRRRRLVLRGRGRRETRRRRVCTSASWRPGPVRAR